MYVFVFVLNFLKRDFFLENSDIRAHIEQPIRNILASYTFSEMGTEALYAFLLIKQAVLYFHVELRTNIHIYKTLNPKWDLNLIHALPLLPDRWNGERMVEQSQPIEESALVPQEVSTFKTSPLQMVAATNVRWQMNMDARQQLD